MDWKNIAKEAALTALGTAIWRGLKAAQGTSAAVNLGRRYAPVVAKAAVEAARQYAPKVEQAASKSIAETIKATRHGYRHLKTEAVPKAKEEIARIKYSLEERGKKYICPECNRIMKFDGTYHRCQCGFYFRNIA